MNKQNKKKNKRKLILEAALEIFSIKGVDKGTVAEIADKAGIGKGTIYHYFDSKEQIFTQLIDFFFADWMSEWEQVIDSEHSPLQKVEIIIDRTFDIYEEIAEERSRRQLVIMCEIIRFAFQQSLERKSDIGLSELFRKLYAKLKPIIKEGIKEGIFKDQDTKHLCFVAFGLLDGFSIHYLLQKNHYSLEKSREITKNILLGGLLKDEYKYNIRRREK